MFMLDRLLKKTIRRLWDGSATADVYARQITSIKFNTVHPKSATADVYARQITEYNTYTNKQVSDS